MKIFNELTYDEMFQAYKSKDARYNGSFFVAIKSTKIFCIPTCKAKFPLEKNIDFFGSIVDAKIAGYRGCKRCRAEFYPNNQPEWLNTVLNYLTSHPNQKLSEHDVITTGKVDITTVRRYFRDYFGTSVMSYHRKLRLNYAKDRINGGCDIKEIAETTGFKTVKGFIVAYKKEFNELPEVINVER